jgi:hypothetical protein
MLLPERPAEPHWHIDCCPRTQETVMKAMTTGTSKQPPKKDVAATYDEFKEFEGRRYTGMRVGRSHKWKYDPGVWIEKKISPDEWQINYEVIKRRAGHAPEGSGVPVGTAYHWYILAHQNVTKLNANDYSTSLTGMKFKLAHLRAGKGTWSASTSAQRRHLIKILQQVLNDLQREATTGKRPTPRKATARGGGQAPKRTTSNNRASAKHPRAA